MDGEIEQRYQTPSVPGSFQGPAKVYNSAKRSGIDTTQAFVKEALQGQESYTLNRSVVRKFPRNRVVVEGIDSQWDSDLADLALLSTKNDGYKYLLVMIDIFSRYAWVRPLKTKFAKEVVKAMDSIFKKGRKPAVLRSDGGKEYNNAIVKTYLTNQGIHHFRTFNETKANYSERLIKTLKSKLYRYMVANNTLRYINVVQDMVKSYNNTVHSSLGRPPSEVYKGNEDEVRYEQYLRRPKQELKPQRYTFKPSDKVRIALIREKLDRDYGQKWSGEVFIIVSRRKREGIPIYTLKDLNGEPVEGTFYQQQLQRINVDEDGLFKIDKILKRRRRNGVNEVLVRWKYYGPKFDSWVREDSIEG